jgi:hypothetical protein
MKRLMLICLLLLVSMASAAQDATETPEPEAVEYAFEFPVDVPTETQISEAYDCVFVAGAEEETDTTPTPEAELEVSESCALANEALAMAAERGEDEPASDEEIELFHSLVEANPALALRIDMIARYFNVSTLVAPPDFAEQPIVSLHLTYTFSGLGPSNDYDVTITDVNGEPQVSGAVEIRTGGEDDEPLTLPETVNSEIVQAFGAALSDLLPIEEQFSAVPCLDYYPDWTVELTFEDGTDVTLVTNDSNVIGIGGPWQVEIDGQNYMQYSGAIITAVVDLFEALELPLGTTGGMSCFGAPEPLWDGYPREMDEAEE